MRLVVLVLLLWSSLAHANKVAVIDTDRLYEPGGIARWLAARAKLDGERGSFRVVERPGGTSDVSAELCKDRPQSKPCQELKQLEQDSVKRRAWEDHERGVLAPIEAEVATALEAFAKARGIDLLLEKDDAMIYVSSSADVTAAFIKDYNAKRPAPKPAPPKRP